MSRISSITKISHSVLYHNNVNVGEELLLHTRVMTKWVAAQKKSIKIHAVLGMSVEGHKFNSISLGTRSTV